MPSTTALKPEQVPADSKQTLDSFTKNIGFTPNRAKVPADEIILARKGHASDPKRDAVIQFARKVIETRGQVSDSDLKAIRDAGYTNPVPRPQLGPHRTL